MKCIKLKQGFNKLKCKRTNKEITFADCKNCEFKEYKNKGSKLTPSRTPIKQRTAKQAKLERDRYSIITDDLKICAECGNENCDINLHEIFYGTGKRKLSIKYGLVIPLCSDKCHDQVNSTGIHFDTVMRVNLFVLHPLRKYLYLIFLILLMILY